METNYPLKLWVYTFCYNEEKILPYIIEYWKQYATKVIVYDNGSTDNSLKILSQYSWIEVREFDTENTFDPEKISQYKSFCYADAIGKADYVMVCDIDEVLLPTENLLPELVLAKKDNVQLFQTKYYEIINNELNPKYDSPIHIAEGYYAYPNTNIHKAIVFDPLIKISFGPNSLSYTTDIDYKTNSIITLHLKLFNASIFADRQKHLISRLKTSYKFSSDSLYYGSDKNIGTRMSYFKLLFPYKYRFNKNENYITITDNIYTANNQNIQFKDMAWLPAQINHNSENTNKECIFGIPVYKSALTVTEKASLNQLCKIIGNEYELCLICPADMALNEYFEIADKHNIKLSTLFCAKQYFRGTKTYSFMCETADFYKCFNEYKYLFIYQLDGWIFENKVKEYLDLNVDYIGSPWDINTFHFQTETVGNGGVSLRRVEKFINICNSLTASDYSRDYVDREDLFFCKTMVLKSALKKPSVKQACGFSISGTGMQGYFMRKYNDGKLPMCLHAWHKDLKYWTKYIDLTEFNETAKEPIKIPVPQKNDYKTRLELIKMRLNNTSKPLNIQPKKIENKKEIKQNTTMSSSYSSFLASYYGIKPKNNEIKWNGYSKTQPAKPAVPTKKVEEKKVEAKQTNSSSKTVAIFCCGRIGNILFELATGLYYAKSVNATEYYLVNENVNQEKIEYLKNINNYFPTLLNNIKIIDKSEFNKIKNKFTILYERTLEKPLEKPNKDLIYIDGYRECPSYWNNDKNFIFNIFKDDNNIIEKIKLANNINFSEYVAINIRRGDYLKSDISNRLGNLSIKYFKNCIEKFDKKQKFLIISDDIEWCKSQFTNSNFIFADKTINGVPKMCSDFWIQTLCHDNIIGNSTFSWWAAYLNKTPNRKVYAPKQFFKLQSGTSKIPKNDNWILMDTIWDNTTYEYNKDLDQKVNTIIPIQQKNNKVVFTCISGNVDKKKFKDPLFISPGFDYICYVDDPKKWTHIKKWQIRQIPEELKNLDATKQNRAIKLNPHKYFKEYDLSVYVDGNVELKGDLNKLLLNILDNTSIYIPKHPQRNCIYKEADVCKGWKDTAENINPQINKFKAEGFPENYGLTQNNIIIRKHNDPNCIKLMEYWWNIVLNGSKRDQLSLFYAKWKTNVNIKILDTKLNNSEYFKWQGTH